MDRFKYSSHLMMEELERYEHEKTNKNKNLDSNILLHFFINFFQKDNGFISTERESLPIRSEFLSRMEEQMSKRTKEREGTMDYNPFFTDFQDENEEPNPREFKHTPYITNNSRAIVKELGIVPIYTRYEQELKNKKRKLEGLREDKKLKENAKINALKKIQKKRRYEKLGEIDYLKFGQDNFYHENIKWYEMKENKIKNLIADRIKNQVHDQNLTFKPRINERSRDVLADKTFQERQEHFEKRKLVKQVELMKKLPIYTFKPNLNKESLKIAERKKMNEVNDNNIIEIQFSPSKVKIKENKKEFKFKGFTALKRIEQENQISSRRTPTSRSRSKRSKRSTSSRLNTEKSESPIKPQRLSRKKKEKKRTEVIPEENYSFEIVVKTPKSYSKSVSRLYETPSKEDFPTVIAISPKKLGKPPLVKTEKLGRKRTKKYKERETRVKNKLEKTKKKKRKGKSSMRGSSLGKAFSRTSTINSKKSDKVKRKLARKRVGKTYTNTVKNES